MMNAWLAKLAEVPPTDEQMLEQSLADLPNGELLEIALEEGAVERPTQTQELQDKVAAATRAGRELAHDYGWHLKKEALVPGIGQALSAVGKGAGKVLSHPAARVGMGALNAKGRAQSVGQAYESMKFAQVGQTLRSAGQGLARGIHNNPWVIPAGAAAAGAMMAPNDREGHKDYLPGAMVAGGLGLGAYYGLGGKQGIQDRIAGTGDHAGKPIFGQETADVATMPKDQYQAMRQAAKAQAQGTPPQGVPTQHVPPQSEALFGQGMDKMHDPSLSSVMPAQPTSTPAHSGMVQIPSQSSMQAAAPAQAGGGFSQALRAQGSPAGAAPAPQQAPAHLQGPSPWREQTGGFSHALRAGGAPPDPAQVAQQARAAPGAPQLSPAAAARKQEIGMRMGKIQRPQDASSIAVNQRGFPLVQDSAPRMPAATGPIPHGVPQMGSGPAGLPAGSTSGRIQIPRPSPTAATHALQSPAAAAGKAVAQNPNMLTKAMRPVSKMMPKLKIASPLQKAAMLASFHKVAMMSPFGMGASGGATGAKYNTGGVISSAAPQKPRNAPSAPQPSSVMASSSRPSPRPSHVPPPIPGDAVSKKPFAMQSVAKGPAPTTSALGVAGKAVSTPKLPGVMGALRPR